MDYFGLHNIPNIIFEFLAGGVLTELDKAYLFKYFEQFHNMFSSLFLN